MCISIFLLPVLQPKRDKLTVTRSFSVDLLSSRAVHQNAPN